MNTHPRHRLVFGSRSIALVAAAVWAVFTVTALSSYYASAQPYRPVNINGVHKGNVELFNLQGGTGLNVRFCPANGDLNIINGCSLNWVQIINRPGDARYPRVDPPNNLDTYPKKNHPFYYDNGDDQNLITNKNYYWMRDFPGVGGGAYFETWLVTTQGNNVQRLVCFNWGFTGGGVPAPQPGFINGSTFNWNQALNKSALRPYWTIADFVSSPIPTATEWGLILLTVLLMAAGSMAMRRTRAEAGPGA